MGSGEGFGSAVGPFWLLLGGLFRVGPSVSILHFMYKDF